MFLLLPRAQQAGQDRHGFKTRGALACCLRCAYGYRGLAALHEATGSDPSDGTNSLRDISQALTDAGYQTQAPPEPELAVGPSASSSHWQETSAEFNRRMNSLYSSNAWSGVYRTVFSGGLYP